jgi:hypothetical protein
MDPNERQVIDDLFGKLRQVEQQAPQRDAEADAYIRQQVSSVPAAPYYMAQAMLVQEQALATLQSRTQELERQLAERPASGGGGFLSGLFGGGQSQDRSPAPSRPMAPAATGMMHQGMGAQSSPWGSRPGGAWSGRGGGGGFLAGAMQTAVGVAGGLLVADALTSAFSGGEEAVAGLAEEASATAGEAMEPFQDASAEQGVEQQDVGGFDDGGGFEEI